MADHDQRFKVLLQEFLGEFFELFFPEWAARFDFSQPEWLTQEVFADPPQGQRRSVDLVVKLQVREAIAAQRPDQPQSEVALIHVEVESAEKVAPLRARMYDYYNLLRSRHGLPVVPVALYLRVGLGGIGWDTYEEHLWDHCMVRFEYLYVGLPVLEGEQYVSKGNLLGVALSALMRVAPDRKAWLKAEALRQVEATPANNWRKLLVCECIDAYMPLDPEQQQIYDRLLDTEPYRGISTMTTTWHRQGKEEGHREMLHILLQKKFGALSPDVEERLKNWPANRLSELAENLLQAQSLRELGLEGENGATLPPGL